MALSGADYTKAAPQAVFEVSEAPDGKPELGG
jgi:hypothetical protein